MTNYSRSVLKSNGLRHSKNPPVKFSFSLKIVPATIAKKLPPQRCFKPLLIPIFNFSYKRPTFAFTGESGYTHTRLSEKDRTQGHTRRNRGRFGWGGITTLGAFRTFANIPGPGIRTANFAALGTWSRVLSKNAESLRDSDALMRVAVPRHRGPAGLRDLFQFCRNCDLYAMRACARHGRYHYPQRALRAAETPDDRLSKRLICRFLRSGGHH